MLETQSEKWLEFNYDTDYEKEARRSVAEDEFRSQHADGDEDDASLSDRARSPALTKGGQLSSLRGKSPGS